MNFQTYLKVINYTIVILMHLMVVLAVIGSTGLIVGLVLLLLTQSAKYVLIYSGVALAAAVICGITGIVLSVWRVEQ